MDVEGNCKLLTVNDSTKRCLGVIVLVIVCVCIKTNAFDLRQ